MAKTPTPQQQEHSAIEKLQATFKRDPVETALGETSTQPDVSLAPIPALTLTTASLPDAGLAIAYNASIQASGGRPFYYFQLESGTLPHGLALNGKGEIKGVPSALGTFNFTVRVTDSTRPLQSVTQAYSITVGAYTGPGWLISGRIITAGAVPVPGVILVGLPGGPGTNSFGEYVAPVPLGWSGTVTPPLAGYAFTPANKTYLTVPSSLSGQDYTATGGYAISGTVKMNGAPFAGAPMKGARRSISGRPGSC